MTQQEIRDAVGQMREFVQNEMPDAKRPEEVKFALMTMIGIALVGELLVDIKRIADAAERANP